MAYEIPFMTVMPVGVQLDASFPKSKTWQGTLNGAGSITSDNFSTTGIRRIVVTVAYNSFDNAMNPATLAWNGGTPANAGAFTAISNVDMNYTFGGIWEATTTGDCTDVSIVFSRTGTSLSNDSAGIAIYSFANVGSIGTPTNIQRSGDLAVLYNATLTTQASGSYVVLAACVASGSDQTAAANQVDVNTAQVVGADWCKNAYKIPTSTSTNVGWGVPTEVATWIGFAAVEVKP